MLKIKSDICPYLQKNILNKISDKKILGENRLNKKVSDTYDLAAELCLNKSFKIFLGTTFMKNTLHPTEDI
jgi:hypothetical protein